MLRRKQEDFKEILNRINFYNRKNGDLISLVYNNVIIMNVRKIIWCADYLKIYNNESYNMICMIKLSNIKNFKFINDCYLYNKELHLFN